MKITLEVTDEQWETLTAALGVAAGDCLARENPKFARKIEDLFHSLQNQKQIDYDNTKHSNTHRS